MSDKCLGIMNSWFSDRPTHHIKQNAIIFFIFCVFIRVYISLTWINDILLNLLTEILGREIKKSGNNNMRFVLRIDKFSSSNMSAFLCFIIKFFF